MKPQKPVEVYTTLEQVPIAVQFILRRPPGGHRYLERRAQPLLLPPSRAQRLEREGLRYRESGDLHICIVFGRLEEGSTSRAGFTKTDVH